MALVIDSKHVPVSCDLISRVGCLQGTACIDTEWLGQEERKKKVYLICDGHDRRSRRSCTEVLVVDVFCLLLWFYILLNFTINEKKKKTGFERL